MPLNLGGCGRESRQAGPNVTAEMRTEGQALFGQPLETPLVAPRVVEDEPSMSPTPFGDTLDGGGRPLPALSRSEGWSILVSRVPEGGAAGAAARLDHIRTAGGLPEASLQRRSGGLVIAVGAYASPTDARAQGELERVRAIEVNGTRPYASAFFAPPSGANAGGANPEWDLRNVRGRLGSQAEYTLQIGAYARVGSGMPGPDEVRQFRAAAEQAVASLRAEGEQAFYFHGSTSSTVTVGVFAESDHDASVTPPIESRRLREARERHPNNLVNGAGFRETMRTDSGQAIRRLQKSQLVQIPRG